MYIRFFECIQCNYSVCENKDLNKDLYMYLLTTCHKKCKFFHLSSQESSGQQMTPEDKLLHCPIPVFLPVDVALLMASRLVPGKRKSPWQQNMPCHFRKANDIRFQFLFQPVKIQNARQ